MPPARQRDASSGETGSAVDRAAVMTRNATGWIGISVPGGSTGRCTPFWPPLLDERAQVGEVAELGPGTRALFAPIGSGAPTCAITTPISPAGTCTHGNFCTAKIGQSLKRRPGISSSAW